MTSSQVNVTETPPMSAEDLQTLAKNETDDNGLILGKFKSVEDLAASYKELEGKLGQVTEEDQPQTEEEQTETNETEFNAEEFYGDGLASVLEEVGIDHYHHTMFEMLGNWSFGDYFKKEIINWSLEILTKVYKLNKDDLYVTVFEGNKEDKLDKDLEAYKFWSEIIDDDKIVLGDKKDNFSEMSETGPCGPCSEIHIDLRSHKEKSKTPAKNLVNKDHPEVIELWNLVFIQYDRKADGSLKELPEKHIDTGMGFERLARIIQQKQSN